VDCASKIYTEKNLQLTQPSFGLRPVSRGSRWTTCSKRLKIAWRSRLKVNTPVDPSPPPRAPHAVWPELRGWNIDLLHMCDACHGNLENSQLPANS